MNLSNSLKLAGVSILLVAGLAACDKQKPGPAESAGKNIDRSMDQAGDKIGAAADKVGDKIESAADKVGDKMSEQSAKAGVVMDDTGITTKVKAAILAESGLKTLQISVETIKGVVTLTGSVDKKSQSDMAQSLAAAVEGVSAVDNRLVARSNK